MKTSERGLNLIDLSKSKNKADIEIQIGQLRQQLAEYDNAK
jgi:hypothetical protein